MAWTDRVVQRYAPTSRWGDGEGHDEPSKCRAGLPQYVEWANLKVSRKAELQELVPLLGVPVEANLLKFSERVDTTKIGSPACLGVIVATGYGYARPDGAVVIPISALRN
jgi:hypothetical protein